MAEAARPEDLKSQNGLDSDSDSGQGSCETNSPAQLNKGQVPTGDGDSDEDIYVSKRVRCKKVLLDSDSEGDDLSPETLEVGTRDADGATEDTRCAAQQKNFAHAFPALEASDSSKTENQPRLEKAEEWMARKPKGRKSKPRDTKAKEDSPRKRRTRKDKKMESVRQMMMKGKPPEQEEPGVKPSFNDSGCLLADKDLFDNGLEDGEEEQLSSGEESLEAIKAAAKQKMRTQKKRLFPEREDYVHTMVEPDVSLSKEPRKERKAAKLSREAMKQLHSETQRLVREAAVPLSYHMPEAKSIHDFFRRKPRPIFQGSAMTLLRSTKYQPGLECAVAKKENMTSCASDPSATEDSGVRVDPQDPVLQNLAPGGTSAGGVESATDTLEEEEEDDDSETQRPGDELPTEKAGDPDGNTAARLQPPETREEATVLEPRREPPLDSFTAPKETAEPPAASLPVPRGETKRSKLAQLRELAADLALEPRLCAGDASFIELDEPKPNRDLEALKERFVKHAFHAPKPKSERTLSLNIIRKETTPEGREELKADVVPVVLPVEAVEEATHAKPGEKLCLLKAKLQEAMKLRRTEERQRRQALFKLDNEDMLEEEEEEEEEEDMTDESDDDEEEEEEEEGRQEGLEYLLGEAEEDHDEVEEDDGKGTDRDSADEEQTAKFAHRGVELRPASTESTLLLFKDNSSKTGCSFPCKKAEIEEVMEKRSGKPDDEDSFLLPNLLAKDSSHNSSFELIGSMIPSYQPCNRPAAGQSSFLSTRAAVRSPSPGFFKTSFVNSASKSSGKASEPSLPVEDSQDLYNGTPEEKSPVQVPSGDFQFSLEDGDTQSQLLDADGFLNVGHQRSKYQPPKDRLPLASLDENAMDANMGELLDLCSGQFASQEKPSGGRKPDMEELLNLCSGKFTSQASPIRASSATPGREKKHGADDPMAEAVALCSGSFPAEREEDDVDDEEEKESEDFKLLTGNDAFDSEEDCQDEKSDREEDVDEEEGEEPGESEADDEEEVLRRRERLKKKFQLQDFMEHEAELSGSDGASEDEYDGEELDRYEEDELDEALPTVMELQDQVNKIHRKVMLDDDKRQLRLYQERYLADGDLHSDGPGRVRRFRWKNLDDSSLTDLFHKDGEEEDEENGDRPDESEAAWRKERFEREQWLREQSEKGEEEDLDENSQFMKLAKKVTAKSLQNKVTPAIAVPETKALLKNPFETFHPTSNPKLKNGSLLNRPKAVLEKLASLPHLNPNAPRNSRNFVFQTLSPVKPQESQEKPKAQVIKKRAPGSVATPPPKRLRPDGPSAQETRSIFQYLER